MKKLLLFLLGALTLNSVVETDLQAGKGKAAGFGLLGGYLLGRATSPREREVVYVDSDSNSCDRRIRNLENEISDLLSENKKLRRKLKRC